MKLDPDEEKLLESFERGDWTPIPGDEIARMCELARQQLRVDVEAGFDAPVRGEGYCHDAESGRRLADQIKARSRGTRSTKS